SAYLVSYKAPPERLQDGPYILEHRPKPMPSAKGLSYHWADFRYAVSLLQTALRFRSTVAVLESGTTQFFWGFLFRLAGIPVVTVLHNTIWPAGFPPSKVGSKAINFLDGLFFRWGSSATIGVSPVCTLQVEQITNGN